ncbi:GNAT family N-acetyltransferase [Jatrophihabitans telluris]|uniref:GNAT family N-acetyltransferase n=1 Tax=Jatrophihabitans telluris TaxID=2038343 RepID=A0ABY4R029_9ACTN|nr:GNAT family N-acetyltransferase [Jatrophihabitans telluris]UQX88515.1 GNAT family N-acetyltransferase [Jatrophihabitans telluris]
MSTTENAPSQPTDPRIRRVELSDLAAVVGLVHALAEYEKEPAQCTLTEEQLTTALFSETPALFGHVAVVEGTVVGCALWFLNFSTWRGVHGVYLEDLFVLPSHRGSGLGKALLRALALECATHDYGRLEWAVLNWNSPSIAFYRSLGAIPLEEWTTFRLDDAALLTLAAG